ncbi:MAG: cysteine desulfurase family protein [Planctomycetota bacterium]
MIYLDNNATTRPSAAVREAMGLALAEFWQNPSSVHRGGQEARREVELARRAAAEIVGVRAREIVFCGDGTEAIEIAIRGRVQAMRAAGVERPVVATTAVEHAAVRDLVTQMDERGEAQAVWLPLGEHGIVDVSAVERLDPKTTACVSVQWANNETGVVQPVERLAAACQRVGVAFHIDATQWIGKAITDLSLPELAGVSLLTYSPHKFHGPKGIGVLVARRGTRLAVLRPGSQELGRRGGTENVPGIVGAGVACREAMAFLHDEAAVARVAALRDRFQDAVLAAHPEAVVTGLPACSGGGDRGASGEGSDWQATGRLWNTTNIAFPRLEAEALLLAMSERGLAASAGAACSSGSLEASPVLRAMGVPDHVAFGAVRFSLSRETTDAEIDEALTIVRDVVAAVGRSLPA